MEGRTIGNVNILDIRNASEAAVASIRHIGNVNILLHSKATAALIGNLRVGNLNATLEVPAEAAVQNIMGTLRIRRDYFANLKAPVYLFVFGQAVIESDVLASDIEQWVGGITVFGQMLYPQPLAGVVGSKAKQLYGQMMAYPVLARIEYDGLTLDANWLNQLPDGTAVAVIGDVHAPDVLSSELLQRKVKVLNVTGRVTCHEENAPAISACLAGSARLSTIPAGFTEIRRPLALEQALIQYLPARKLYCTELVQIAADVDAALLDQHLDALIARDLVLCPLALQSTLARKCNPFENKIVFYEGALMLADGDSRLSAARLSAMRGRTTLVVTGELKIDPDVTPAMLADHLARVHNRGQISGSPAQLAAVEALLGLHEGHLQDTTPSASEQPSDDQLAQNVNLLTL